MPSGILWIILNNFTLFNYHTNVLPGYDPIWA
jgi:hypothetical protein